MNRREPATGRWEVDRREPTSGPWELIGIVARAAFLIAALALFVYACLTDDYGMAIFWGVTLLMTEIRAAAEAVTR